MTENTGSETEDTNSSEEESEEPGPTVTDTDFYVPQEVVPERAGKEGAVYGGPYLDEVDRAATEDRRALMEDREPDYENMPANAGTPLLAKASINPDGLLPEGAEPNQTLPVVSGSFELDDDGENTDSEKSYLTTKVSNKEAPKKATAKKVTAKKST